MIAKRGKLADRSRRFGEAARYACDAGKAENIRLTNYNGLAVDAGDLEKAIQLSEAIQHVSRAAKTSKNYHLIVSFPEGENPSVEVLADIEDHIAVKLGFGDHERISAVHRNTDNVHLHIIINRVHPDSLRVVTPYRDLFKLSEACREMELKHGLMRDNGLHFINDKGEVIKDPSRKRNERRVGFQESAMVEHRGIESFAAWAAREPANAVKAMLAMPGADWERLHATLARYNLKIVERGNGLAVVDAANSRLATKASGMGRWMTKAALEQLLGEYRSPADPSRLPGAVLSYQERPQSEANSQRMSSRNALYSDFVTKRNSHIAAKQAALESHREKANLMFARLADEFRERKADVRASDLATAEKKTVYALLAMERVTREADLRAALAAERKEIRASKAESYREFVTRRALEGDDAALAALRSLRPDSAVPAPEENAIRPVGDNQGADLLDRSIQWQGADLSYKVNRRGDVLYSLNGRTALVDEGRAIKVAQPSDVSTIELGLRLAQKKYGSVLAIQGSDDFKRRAVETAVQARIRITFADPQLEAMRQKMEAEYAAGKVRRPARPSTPRDAAIPAPAPAEQATEATTKPVAELDEYLARRNALVGVAQGVYPHRQALPGETIDGTLAGIRSVGNRSVALIETSVNGQREVVVASLPADTVLKSKHKGDRIEGRILSDTLAVDKRTTRGRGR